MILRVEGRGEVDSRSFRLTDMVQWGYNGLRYTPGGGSDAQKAQAVPAINRAARMRAEAVASLRLCCWRGYGVLAERADSVWQAKLFAKPLYNEYQTRFAFWETVEESLAYRGNSYIWKNVDPQTGRVMELSALHPDQVDCGDDGSYQVLVVPGYIDPTGHGKGKYVVNADTILHIRGHGDGGMVMAPSPIQVFKEALKSPLSRMRHENRMWQRGTAIQQVVTFPPNVTPDQAEQWKPQWAANYSGSDGDTTAVLGGGATLTPIGMSLVDAQYVDMAHLTREDASLIMGVPANLLGAQLQRAVPNLEQDLATWLRFGLGPELERIESALSADPQLFPPGAQTDPKFDTDEFVRGDLITEANILHLRIQDGTMTPDEGRATLGLPPHPKGVGAVPQITPVGGAPNQNGGGAQLIPAAYSPEPSE